VSDPSERLTAIVVVPMSVEVVGAIVYVLVEESKVTNDGRAA